MSKRLFFQAVAAVALAVSGCSTPTKVTDQWTDPSHVAGPMNKVVVFAQRLPPASRYILEDRFVGELEKRGVQAAPSYRVLGDELPDGEEARAMLAHAGFDGALVLRLERISERPRYVGGYFYGPYGPYWWGTPMYDPGYVVFDETVNFETSLWDLRDGKRVWTANTRTDNPSSSRDFAKSLSKEVLPELSDQRLLAESPH
jgi:hypothetical protein